jgi:Zn-dependent M28 family amino/carboxypeptidase
MGTVALLSAARSFAAKPTKRSVIILAVTGEEIGLLGSQYYASQPLVPLENTIFNLNTDGAGYNDVTKVSMLGFGRTGTDKQLNDAAESVGLTIIADPAPEQGLFDRSDNVSFAREGVPALTLSPGFHSFDAEIQKFYHQVTDEADSIDFDYLYKYCRAFVEAARNIANMEGRPIWKAGDKYEQAGKDLYKR